jgi:tape measure domain-containing protein
MADAILGVGVDPTGAKQGRDEVVRSLDDIRNAARQMSADVGKANQQLGSSSTDMATKMARDFENARRQIEQMKAAGASGGDMSKFLRDMERDMKAAISGLNASEWRFGIERIVSGMTELRRAAFDAGGAIGGGGAGGGSGGGAGGSAAGGMPLVPAMGIFQVAAGTALANAATAAVASLRQMVAGVIQTADAWDAMRKRVTAATADIGDGRQVFDSLRRSVIASGGEMQGAVTLFQNMARAAGTLGSSNQEIVRLVDTVQKLGAIGGSSPYQMQAGLLQLSQGMSLGILRGQDLRSVIEQIPEVANAIARSLGVTIGQLRLMGETGELTGRKVMNDRRNPAPAQRGRNRDLGRDSQAGGGDCRCAGRLEACG